ncbi:MAG: hypothetical protein GAK43_01647 [Stenotrophomonas maltophilia]|nr:MAG: hypothetical protein GAK43_01647 [Stenotrophomonas maltophilia]
MSGTLGFGEQWLGALNLRLIAPDRPGLGSSTAQPGKTLGTWANDIGALLHARQSHSFSVIGFSQGSAFALALGQCNGLKSLTLVAAQDQLSHPPTYQQLSPDIQQLVRQRQEDPAGFEQWLTEHASAQWLLEFVLSNSGPYDLQVYRDPAFLAAYRRCLDNGFSQGPAGYARDLSLALGPWPVQPEAIQCPVHLWYGLRDSSSVHSPDAGALLAQRFARTQLTQFPEEGGALLWTRSQMILQAIASHLD